MINILNRPNQAYFDILLGRKFPDQAIKSVKIFQPQKNITYTF